MKIARAPSAYGYDAKDLPVYFNQDPVFNVAAAGGFGGGGGGGGGFGAAAIVEGVGQNITPNSVPLRILPLDPAKAAPESRADAGAAGRGGRGGGAGANALPQDAPPRVVMQFPANPAEMLLSGTLAGGQSIANKPLAVDVPLGKGHIVLFALRPFWRWQTQGTYFLGFNAILNWNDLDAGKAPAPANRRTASGQ